MWQTGTPKKVAWYLCAWKMGDGYIYLVSKWNGDEWISRMSRHPHTYQEIQSPAEQDKMLDALYENK